MIKSVVLLILLLVGVQSRATVAAEPYLGYSLSKMTFDPLISGGSGTKWDANYFTLGTELRFNFPQFFAGLDYSLESGKADRTSPSSMSLDISGSNLFVIAGVQEQSYSWLVGYSFNSVTTFKDIPAVGDEVITGTAFKLGLGFPINQTFNWNVAYIRKNYDKVKLFGNEASVTGNSDNLLLSLSIPIEF